MEASASLHFSRKVDLDVDDGYTNAKSMDCILLFFLFSSIVDPSSNRTFFDGSFLDIQTLVDHISYTRQN